MGNQQITENDFNPVFIVGAPRSGTTMLSVLLDRHSRISIPPETNFYSEFLPKFLKVINFNNRNTMVEAALSFNRIADLKLERDIVLNRFERYEISVHNLLRAILESYTLTHNKIRSGEKSPKHIEHVPSIFRAFPRAKIICIVRDGRDVVLSLLKVPWAEPGNPRRFGLFCMEWSDLARLAIKYRRIFAPESFTLVKYEEILLHPERELVRLCNFIGEKYESSMLEVNSRTDVVPEWESEWKGKASRSLDPGRINAWQKNADLNQIFAMNCMMKKELKVMGYQNTSLHKCPSSTRMMLYLAKIPYLRPMRPFSRLGLRATRLIKQSIFSYSRKQS